MSKNRCPQCNRPLELEPMSMGILWLAKCNCGCRATYNRTSIDTFKLREDSVINWNDVDISWNFDYES